MGFERLIARRYLGSKRQMRFINIIMLVSVIGITVGVAALVIVLSVFNGFNTVVTQVLVGFDPHVRLEPLEGRSFAYSDSLKQRIALSNKAITGISPFIQSKAMLVASNVNKVVYVKGVVDSTFGLVSGVQKRTVLGKFELMKEDGSDGIIIGMALADRMGTIVGSELTIVSPVGADAIVMQFGQPLTRKFVVTGIFDSNNKDYDANYAFISINAARSLFEFRDGVSGVEMRLSDISKSEDVQQSLAQRLGPEYRILSWYDLHKDLYSVMQIERWTAYIILCLIVGVATFNVLGSLTMGVIEKKRDIGILKSMGATKGSILRLFMFEGILVGTIGTVLGIVIGLVVCFLQIHYHLFPLDPNVYIIPAIPVEIRWMDFVTVSLASMILSTFASLYPAIRAARLLPVEAIRWE